MKNRARLYSLEDTNDVVGILDTPLDVFGIGYNVVVYVDIENSEVGSSGLEELSHDVVAEASTSADN